MSKLEKWVYVILTILATFLMIDRFLLPCVVAAGIMFGLLLCRNFKLYISKLLIPLLVITVVTVLTMALSIIPQFSVLVDLSSSVKELTRIAVYMVVLQTMTMLRLDIHFHNKLWKSITVITVAVVILQFTKLIDINQTLMRFYGYSKQFVYAESSDLSVFRGGSVFINPNMFACFLTAILANYLLTIRLVKESIFSRVIMFGLILIAFILAGSRTGMILATLLILYHIYSTSQCGFGGFIKKALLVVAAIAAGMFLFEIVFSVDLNISDLRIFQVEAGIENSFGSKIEILTSMITNMNGANLLVGYGVFDYAANIQYMVDFDLGYFITFFGFTGLVAYFFMLYGIYSWGDRSLAGRRMRNMMLLLITVVFGLTAGIYFNLRIFTIYLLIFMPSLYDMQTQQRLT